VIDVRTLTDGGQEPVDIARRLAGFLDGAVHGLDLALYDLRLGPETHELVVGALTGAARRGVAVRLAYNVDHRRPIAVPPPPEAEPRLVESIDVPTRGIPGVPDLMHHKYVVRDGETVWTGSPNWTDDSWHREENVIVVVDSRELAARYTADFDQLWETGEVQRSGRVPTDAVRVAGVPVRPWFCPKRGERLAIRIAQAIGSAERRVRIASPVITSGPILGTLAEVVSDGRIDVAGVVDVTQIREVLQQWRVNGNAPWKEPALRAVVGRAPFSG
jgi:hypothetical protein